MTRKPRANRDSVADKALTFRMTAEELRALSQIVDHHNQKLQSLGMAPVATQGSVCRSLIFRESVKLGFLSQVEPPSEAFNGGDKIPDSEQDQDTKLGTSGSPKASTEQTNEEPQRAPVLSRHERAMRNMPSHLEPPKDDNK